MPLEIEFKAEVSAQTLEDIDSLSILQAAAEKNPHAVALTSIYYDTPERHLQSAGISFRLRKARGRWTQTIKSSRLSEAGLHRVNEHSDKASGPEPEVARISLHQLRTDIEEALRGAQLERVFEVVAPRKTRRLRTDAGLVELAIDRGQISAGKSATPVTEIELELLEGDPSAVFDWADALLGGRIARLIQPSKAERGFALADQGLSPSSFPVRTRPSAARLGCRAEDAFRALLGLYARAIAENLHVTFTSTDPEGPHQLRVSLRRLRTALEMFSPILEAPLCQSLKLEAKTLGRIVSGLRDADVMIDEFLAPQLDAADSGDQMLRDELNAWREALRMRVRGQLQEARATGFAIRLLRLADLDEWKPTQKRRIRKLDDAVIKTIAPALDRVCRKSARLGDSFDALGEAARHDLRKKLKTVRYGVEIAAEADSSANSDRYMKWLKVLQDDLGHLNDIVTLDSFAPRLSTPCAERLSQILSVLKARKAIAADAAMKKTAAHWKKFARTPPFWR